MISAEATREGGRSKLQTRFSENQYSKKVTKFISEFGVTSSVEIAPQRIAEKIVVRCSGPLEWFSNRCLVLENGQVESFH